MEEEGLDTRDTCAGCQKLRYEVQGLQQTVRTMQQQMTQLVHQARGNRGAISDNFAASDEPTHFGRVFDELDNGGGRDTYRDGGSSGARRPAQDDVEDDVSEFSVDAIHDPGLRDYLEELNKAKRLRRQSEGIQGGSSGRRSPGRRGGGLNDSRQNVETRDSILRRELETFEKRLLKAMVQLANRVSTLEGDSLRTIDELSVSKKESMAMLESVVRRHELKPLVLQVVETTRRQGDEQVSNLYNLFQLQPAAVQSAVSSRSPQQCIDVVLGAPAFRGIFDMSIECSRQVAELKEMVMIRGVGGPADGGATAKTLPPHQRLLGMDLVDENDLRGLRVAEVYTGSPAQASGIHPGDRICKVNGVAVVTVEDFITVMSGVLPNSVVRLHRSRGDGRNASIVDIVDVIASTGTYLSSPVSHQQRFKSPLSARRHDSPPSRSVGARSPFAPLGSPFH